MVDYQKHHCNGWDYYSQCNEECPEFEQKKETLLTTCWQVNKKREERVIFTAPNECMLTAFGTIKFECRSESPKGSVLVKIFQGTPDKECIVDCFVVDEGSCSSFILSDFNSITVTPRDGTEIAQGELCINPIFSVV